MEPAGTRLPLVPPPSHGWYLETCGTAASAWVQNGSYPLIGEDVMDIKICFAFSEVCEWSVQARTVACMEESGALFYLYYLHPAPKCWLAYCALTSTTTSMTTTTTSLATTTTTMTTTTTSTTTTSTTTTNTAAAVTITTTGM